MSKNVLIVDDDQEFLKLLRGIFEHSGYTVQSAVDVDHGLEILAAGHIDLVITDQYFPGGASGSDLILKVRERDANLPTILISGYLDDETIRDLIRDGVDGIFIKPLNIFSLLKKAGEVLGDRAENTSGSANPSAALKGSFDGIGPVEGLSDVGSQFLDRAREASAFRRNLLLIGPPGTLFEEIAVDIISISGKLEHCVTLKPGQVTWEKLQEFFAGEDAQRNLVLILMDAEKLSPQEVDNLIRMTDEKGGINGILRLVFCLGQTVEKLYDAGSIDEEFYLFLGSNELKIPELKSMPEDLVAMAKRQIEDECEDARFDMKMRSALLEHDWPENMLELRSVIIRAINMAQPMPPQVRHIEAAIGKDTGLRAESPGRSTTLERFLNQEKLRYLEAVDVLLNS